MLVEFSVQNYLSYRDRVTLSMVASSRVSEFRDSNVITTDEVPLLKTAAIYGANASGKSNLLAALGFMRSFVIGSSKESQADEPIDVTPFRLDVATDKKPSLFELTWLMNGVRYRYGFQVDRDAVTSEWLYEAKKEKETPLFLREGGGIDVRAAFAEGKDLESRTRDNALFLSVVANFNGALSGRIIQWFNNMRVAHGLREEEYAHIATDMLQDDARREPLVRLIQRADFGVTDIIAREETVGDAEIFKALTEETARKLRGILSRRRVSLSSVHVKYNRGDPDGTVHLDWDKEESAGTQKFLRLAGPVLESLDRGSLLIVDELEAKLHPLLTRMVIRLFHSEVTNPHAAQLVFATHDTNLLGYVQFRRDQIWFAEKDQREATDLYSLAEIRLPQEDGSDRKVRKDARYEKDYFRGRYGAVPYLGEFEKLLMRGGETDG